jgi:hypothetical protein
MAHPVGTTTVWVTDAQCKVCGFAYHEYPAETKGEGIVAMFGPIHWTMERGGVKLTVPPDTSSN